MKKKPVVVQHLKNSSRTPKKTVITTEIECVKKTVSFLEAKNLFDTSIGKKSILDQSIVPVDGKFLKNIKIRNATKAPLEEYYKWQFIFALVHGGLYPKDYIGTEIRFPKGNKASNPLKIDAAIFDDKKWLSHYNDYWKGRNAEDLEWLNQHLLAVIEFKKNDKAIDKVVIGQVKPAMKEKDPADAYILGLYYDAERLYMFHRRNGYYLRYDESKNQKSEKSSINDLSLHLPDPYSFIPSMEELKNKVNRPKMLDRSKRAIHDLDIVTSIATVQIQDALSNVLRALASVSLVDQRGYNILIQSFALKIFDEKRNERDPKKFLEFYVTDTESHFKELRDKDIQSFIKRMQSIWSEAEGQYQKILQTSAIDWKNQNHIRAVVAVCVAFQDFSFVRSAKSDLYQLVFYNFANTFTRAESAQFLTPLPVIDFIVKIVNPRNDETVFDPCCGIADFLSLSFVHAQEKTSTWQLTDKNIFGVDSDENMIMLATLNMLLNGDGEAKLFQIPDKGSILFKIGATNPPQPVELIPESHKNGEWDANWPDKTKLMKFDVVLTNPPFGEDRAYRPRTPFDRQVIEMYETWKEVGRGDNIDLGIVFLENAYRCLDNEGRLGIVLSNSLASIKKWEDIRLWLINRMRIVAMFDLPPDVFAETGVNTTILIAYKPDKGELKALNESNYSVFVKDIQYVGYEKRTSKRNTFFNPIYKTDETTFEVKTDREGKPILDEQFTQTIFDFREWALGQEETLQKLFLKES